MGHLGMKIYRLHGSQLLLGGLLYETSRADATVFALSAVLVTDGL